MLRIGILSDTHNLLRPETMTFLAGCDHIIHAGDICDPETIPNLSLLAPVTAVRGNNDKGAWAEALAEVEIHQFDKHRIYVIHDLKRRNADLHAMDIRFVVSGHSHKPRIDERDGIIYINPGSAGPRRFSFPVSIAEMLIEGDVVVVRIHDLLQGVVIAEHATREEA